MSRRSRPFLFGAATSSHQIEGHNKANDWWQWEQQKKVPESSALACDSYHRFKEDISLIHQLGHNAHRFSLEWSRFEPQEGRWDEAAFKHYGEVLDELIQKGVEPIVTLHHFTNPIWFSNQGGWENPKAVSFFLRYVQKVVSTYGDKVRFWITLNEPMVTLYFGHLSGIWPPGKKSFFSALKVMRHMIQAHLEAYRWIHSFYAKKEKDVWVSIAKHLHGFEPCRMDSVMDKLVCILRDWFFNRIFLDAVHTGFLFVPGIFCEFLRAQQALDFIGVNYYSRDFVRFPGFRSPNAFLGEDCDAKHHPKQVKEQTDMGWEVYPAGLYAFLVSLKRYKLPVMITENGIATQEDAARSRYIKKHIEAVRQAQQEGVAVWGYFYWSLLDNFEWAHGFSPRFGIVEVDYASQARKIRPSAYVLTDLCRYL